MSKIAPKKTKSKQGAKVRTLADDVAPAAVFGSMPLPAFEAYVEALEADVRDPLPVVSERRRRALAKARFLVHALEVCSDEDPRTLDVVEAVEIAHRHATPGERAKDARAREEITIESLNFGARLLKTGWALPDVAGLVAPGSGISATRWTRALEQWRGETPAARGRPRAGDAPYFWHRVLFVLLTGREGDAEPEATYMRDNLRAWRRSRRKPR